MPGKGKKKQKNAAVEKKKGNKPVKKLTGKKSEGRRSKSARYNVDIFTEVAIENAYTTCHNVQDLLKYRGFPWPDALKKKKKGKK